LEGIGTKIILSVGEDASSGTITIVFNGGFTVGFGSAVIIVAITVDLLSVNGTGRNGMIRVLDFDSQISERG
jgi:hypothetical protein